MEAPVHSCSGASFIRINPPVEADLQAAKDKYDKWTALRRESREYAREQARKHREVLAQIEDELNLPKSLRRYAKKAMDEDL